MSATLRATALLLLSAGYVAAAEPSPAESQPSAPVVAGDQWLLPRTPPKLPGDLWLKRTPGTGTELSPLRPLVLEPEWKLPKLQSRSFNGTDASRLLAPPQKRTPWWQTRLGILGIVVGLNFVIGFFRR